MKRHQRTWAAIFVWLVTCSMVMSTAALALKDPS